jgi:hypothetical protein
MTGRYRLTDRDKMTGRYKLTDRAKVTSWCQRKDRTRATSVLNSNVIPENYVIASAIPFPLSVNRKGTRDSPGAKLYTLLTSLFRKVCVQQGSLLETVVQTHIYFYIKVVVQKE